MDLDLNTFPITVPLLGPESLRYFQPPPLERISAPVQVRGQIAVHYSITDLEACREALAAPGAGCEWLRLLLLGEELSAKSASTEQLIAPRHLAEQWRRSGVVPYPHQLDTARRILFEMDGRAILADEVGLGKTIEAGLVIKECLLRRLAERVLILTPAGLCRQWYAEMREKFNLPCAMQRSEYDWERARVLIASIDTAKRSPHREILQEIAFDILVVDEAHKLKSEKSANYRLVKGIRRKFCLMLTATPMQNDLKELYNLIELVRPGHLGAYRAFKSDFVLDKRTPKETDRLKELLSKVVVRNRRGRGTVQFTKRHVESITIDLSPEERTLYDEVSRMLREAYRSFGIGGALPLITLHREVCSSVIAAAFTLEKMIVQGQENPMFDRLVGLRDVALGVRTNSKADALLRLVADSDEKVIVFTEYRATQQYLRWRLSRERISTLGFDGSLSSSRKGWIRELFRRQHQVLVSTESGGEGLNFQFCRKVVNYDLPWNPMRLEQRIGRVHRLGQEKDVYIYNLATRNSVEEHILYLLYEKINMFQMILGELDAILSKLRIKGSLERELTEILVGSETEAEVRERLTRLAESLMGAKDEADEIESFDRLLSW